MVTADGYNMWVPSNSGVYTVMDHMRDKLVQVLGTHIVRHDVVDIPVYSIWTDVIGRCGKIVDVTLVEEEV